MKCWNLTKYHGCVNDFQFINSVISWSKVATWYLCNIIPYFLFLFSALSLAEYITYNYFLVKQAQKKKSSDGLHTQNIFRMGKKKDKCFFFFFPQAYCHFSWIWESSLAIIRFFKCPSPSSSGHEKNTWKPLIFFHPGLPQPQVIFYWVRLLSLTSHFKLFFVFHVGHAFYNLSLHSFCHSSMSKCKEKKYF